MKVSEAIHNRRSVRKYHSIPVEWHKVTQILEAGRLAPNAGNLQAWRFIVVIDPKMRSKIAHTCLEQYWMATAPVHIVLVSLTYKSEQYYGLRGEKLYGTQDCAAAAENMILTAGEMGISSCWVSAFDENELKRDLGMPDNVRPQVVLTLGYADEVTPRPPKERLETVVFLEQFGNRIRDMNMVMGYYSEVTKRNVNLAKQKIEDTATNIKDTIKGRITDMQNKIDKDISPKVQHYEDKFNKK